MATDTFTMGFEQLTSVCDVDKLSDGTIRIQDVCADLVAQWASEPFIDRNFKALLATIDKILRQARFEQLLQHPQPTARTSACME